MKRLYTVEVKKVYEVVVYCEKEDAVGAAVAAVGYDPGGCNEDTETYGPYEIKVAVSIPCGWENAFPYGNNASDKTVSQLLADASATPGPTREGT